MVEGAERARGRTERRRVEVYSPPAWQDGWPDVGAVVCVTRSGVCVTRSGVCVTRSGVCVTRSGVCVTRSGVRDGEPYERAGPYLTSRTDDAATIGSVIRWHWHVENRLHWVKDALMDEDSGGVRSKAGAAVLALLRGVVLSVVRDAGEWSWTEARARWTNRVPEMLELLRT